VAPSGELMLLGAEKIASVCHFCPSLALH